MIGYRLLWRIICLLLPLDCDIFCMLDVLVNDI